MNTSPGVPVEIEWVSRYKERRRTEGLIETAGPMNAVILVPRSLPEVGARVWLLLEGNRFEGHVIRLNRSIDHPQVAVRLAGKKKEWAASIGD